MSIIQYNSPRGLQTCFDHLFNGRLLSHEANTQSSFLPQVDIAETEKVFELNFSIPGLKKEEIKVDLSEGELTVSGERKLEKEKKEKNFHTLETRYGTFKRSFHLPDTADIEKVSATYEQGILNITIQKSEQKALKSRTIHVK